MNDLIGLVMEAAAIELLHVDALQIDREVQRLLAEMEHVPVEELRRDDFAQRFLELLKRRGEVARKALIIFEEPQSEGPRASEPIEWTISTF
jgi:transcription initiation factor TFIIIB Brf1 subunit/transcription initiation factor TFIIB